MVTLDQSRTAYNVWHKEIPAGLDQANAPWHDLVRAHLEPLKDQTVLEIACGRGGFSLYLDSVGAKIYSLDFSQSALTRAQALFNHFSRPSQLCCADMQYLPLPAEYFDAVVSCETIEHVPEPTLALAEVRRVLKPGGKFYLTTPNYLNLHGCHTYYRKLLGRAFTNQPIDHIWSIFSVCKAIKRAGFEIVGVDGVGHYLPFPGRPPIRLTKLDRWGRRLFRYLALHCLIVAQKR